jgi:hypothetical protein
MLSRRDFLRLSIGGIAAAAAVRTFPFRVYSFPSEIVPAEPPGYWAYVRDPDGAFEDVLSQTPTYFYRQFGDSFRIWVPQRQLIHVGTAGFQGTVLKAET